MPDSRPPSVPDSRPPSTPAPRRPGPSAAVPSREAPHDDERPPILGYWPAVYAVVLGELLLVIALCGWLNGWGR